MTEPETETSRASRPWNPKLSMLMLVGMFAVLAFMVPSDWVKKLNALIQPKTVAKGVYSQNTATLDEALASGTVKDLDALSKHRAEIQLRRLAKAGPMTGDEVRATIKILNQSNKQLDLEPTPGSRAAMREELSKRMAKTLPRFQLATISRVLDTFDTQYQRAMTIKQAPAPKKDPSSNQATSAPKEPSR